MTRREHALEAGRCLAVAHSLLVEAFDLDESCDSDFDAIDAARMRSEAGDWRRKAHQHDEAARADITTGSLVTYDHPDWGRVRGRVFTVDTVPRKDGHIYALVQDLSPNGAREWWPVDRLTPTKEPT